MKNGQSSIKVYAILLASVVSFFLFAAYIFAAASQPQGPTSLTIDSSGRYQNNSNPITVQANAGNVTGLTIASTRITQSWQGYFGNISGTITLDDANNFTFYDWSLPSPSGEVYASNGSIVTWANVYCMNVSANGTNPVMGSGAVANINGTQIELNFGVNITNLDGLTETFNDTYVDTLGFRTGSVVIDRGDGCSMAHPYSNQAPNTVWQEMLLSDNVSLIFTAIVNQDQTGFQGGPVDFQIMVLENGQVGFENSVTNYYFFVELQ